MRQHFQGLILLIAMLLVLWVTTSMAGPVISDALSGDDRALRAEAAEVVPLGEEEELAVPLNGDEILELQAALTQLGYDPGAIDGLMGPSTEAAVAQALIDRDLPATTDDRSLLELLQAELGTGPDSAEPGIDSATPAPDSAATDDQFVNEPEPEGTPEG
jgi:peptidoglycan hydrolase-like protein with peptidoglycan-binding domain